MVCVQQFSQSRHPHQTDVKPCLAVFEKLRSVLSQEDPATIARWTEYISIPLFLLLPADAAQAPSIPERIREEALLSFRVCLVEKIPGVLTNRRNDLFFPIFLRALASLTDLDNKGELVRGLKEETKMQALLLLHALFTLPAPVVFEFNSSLTLHCAALVLDLTSRTREKSR
jgi:hypothetical protein